jgi:hypothetical protein
MKDPMAALAIVGTAASILGAVISMRQASKAKRAADVAEAVKQEIGERTTLSALSGLSSAQQRAVIAMSKYGPGSTASSTAGADPQKDGEVVREYLLQLREHLDDLGPLEGSVADKLCDDVFKLLDEFSSADDDQQRLIGSRILIALNRFSPRLRALVRGIQAGNVGITSA